MRSTYSSRIGLKPPSTSKCKKTSEQSLLPAVLVNPCIVRADSQNDVLQAFAQTQNVSAKTSLDRLLSMNSPVGNLQIDPASDFRSKDCMPLIKNLSGFEANSGF